MSISAPVKERISAGSSLKFCLVAEGRADLYPRLGPTMEWDTAAGQPARKTREIGWFTAISRRDIIFGAADRARARGALEKGWPVTGKSAKQRWWKPPVQMDYYEEGKSDVRGRAV